MPFLFLASILGSLLLPAAGQALEKAEPDLKSGAAQAISRGLAFLDGQQKPEGFWSSREYPGLSALVVQGYLAAPSAEDRKRPAAAKALAYLRGNAKPDGGIYHERMGIYNTSICLTALLLAADPADRAIIDRAHQYLTGGQTKGAPNPASDGGFGYEIGGGKGGGRADLDNTVFALEALKRYRDAQQAREQKVDKDLDWEAAIGFVSRCQQLSSHNREPWVSETPEEKGGFVYTPSGEGDRGEGRTLRSYGTMTYAGLLSFVYADLKANDPRVKAALDWISRRYTLEENPGQGTQGLYYYYHMMAKSLTAAGIDELETKNGKKTAWRTELTRKLLALQKPDGSWANTNGRWMEKDPNLVTAYCLLALATLHAEL